MVARAAHPSLFRRVPYGKALLVCLCIACYWLLYWLALSKSPLGRDIDFDGDGNISLMEALDAEAMKTLRVRVNGQDCIDYVEPKTGSTWKVVCPN